MEGVSMRNETTLHQQRIYRVIDDDGNVLRDLGGYVGEFGIGDQIIGDGKPRRVVETSREQGHSEVVLVKTVAEAPGAKYASA